jgi:hypothetical protein
MILGKSKRFFPGFLSPSADKERIAFLKGALRREMPDADEIRYLHSHAGFFLWAIRFPPGVLVPTV